MILTPFSVNCQWSNWASYASCSKTCGGGTKQRQRYKTVQESNGGSCSGLTQDTVSCNTQDCPGHYGYPSKIQYNILLHSICRDQNQKMFENFVTKVVRNFQSNSYDLNSNFVILQISKKEIKLFNIYCTDPIF